MDNSGKGNHNGSYACEKMPNCIMRRTRQIKMTLRYLRNHAGAWTRSKRRTGASRPQGETGPAGGGGGTETSAAPQRRTWQRLSGHCARYVPLYPTVPETGAIPLHLQEVTSLLVYRDTVNNSARLATTKVPDNWGTAP